MRYSLAFAVGIVAIGLAMWFAPQAATECQPNPTGVVELFAPQLAC